MSAPEFNGYPSVTAYLEDLAVMSGNDIAEVHDAIREIKDTAWGEGLAAAINEINTCGDPDFPQWPSSPYQRSDV